MNWFRKKASVVLLRLVPRARTWTQIGDFVSFTSRGFVAANSPEGLLGRHNYEVSHIRSVLGARRFASSLEVGCGFGRLSPHLGANSDQHVAIDINAKALESARRYYPGFRFWEASVVDLPFADDTFDLITTWTVLQHVPPNFIDSALSEIIRVSKPGALILLCEETAQALKQGADQWHTHTWHRTPEFYRDRLSPFDLTSAEPVVGLSRLGSEPGTVMKFERQ